MSKLSTTLAMLGAVSAWGVAALPLSSYAAVTKTSQAKVQVEVEGAIGMTIDNHGDGDAYSQGLLDLGKIMLGGVMTDAEGIDVIVNSNDSSANYNLGIKSLTNETALVTENDSKIPAASGSEVGNIAAGTSAWGYYVANEKPTISVVNWKGVTASGDNINSNIKSNQNTAQTGGTGDYKDTTTVWFAASASDTQAEGVYTGTVVFTATVNN